MKRALHVVVGWIIALITISLTLTCRRRKLEDSRPALRDSGRHYVLAGLHAHQAAMVFFNDEARLAAVVSRSTDGELLVPSLRARGVTPVRGSTAKNGRDKGGARALVQMIRLVRDGAVGLITVDGPRGPRNTVHPGILKLAERSEAQIVPVAIVPSARLILKGTWDRMQIPLPFSRLDYAFGPPLDPGAFDSQHALADALKHAIDHLERRYDPKETAQLAEPVPARE
ncbi:MAG: DUF374 domain-containing protein [Myxococcota bacterium]